MTCRTFSSLLLICLTFFCINKGDADHWYSKTLNQYTFIITRDLRIGPFGTLSVIKDKLTSYSLVTSSPFISIERATGIISLKRSLPAGGISRISHQVRISKIFYGRLTSGKIALNIVLLPKYFGDVVLRQYMKPGKVLMNADDLSSYGDTSTAMHRFLRYVSSQMYRKSFNEGMSSMTVEKTAKLVEQKIIYYSLSSSDNLKSFALPWNSLYSPFAVNVLREKSKCEPMYRPKDRCFLYSSEQFRTIDGTCNNLRHKDFGAAPNKLQRLIQAKYFDFAGLNDPLGFPNQPFAPQVPPSFKVAEKFIIGQTTSHKKPQSKFSHLLMQWGQWLDHDLSLSPVSEGSNQCKKNSCSLKASTTPPCYNIQRPGSMHCLMFRRSMATCPLNSSNRFIKREQINVNTAFIDGSQIYGSTEEVAKRLRCYGGFLNSTMNGQFLPFNNKEQECRFRVPGGCFIGGDSRVNEQVALASMHTLFLREHNRIVRELGRINPHWSGERKYQETRKIIGAVLQKITYEDYLPIILGSNTLSKYKRYDNTVNPGILNSFSTAAYRFGHSSIRQNFDLLNENFDPIADPLPLRHMFFNNSFITKYGIDPLLLGLLGNTSEIVDRKLASGLLNNLFERPNSPGLNLAVLNIQRGRDHGLPGYNAFRRFCGLSHAATFYDTKNEIRDRKARETLRKLYNDDPEIADLWPAGLAENPVNGGTVGPTFQCIIKIQLQRLRDGDRFFFEREGVFTSNQLAEIRKTSVSRIFCDNLEVVSIQKDAFLAGSSTGGRVGCNQLPKIDLTNWKDYR